MMNHLRILFLCTGNSCRSQMAEGWARELRGEEIEAYSAGVEPHELNQRAVAVMKEVGVNIAHQQSKHVDSVKDVDFDYVITVCDRANQSCPTFPAKTRVVHVGFEDPPVLARAAKTEDEALSHYRRVRDEIRDFVKNLESVVERHANEDQGSSSVKIMAVKKWRPRRKAGAALPPP